MPPAFVQVERMPERPSLIFLYIVQFPVQVRCHHYRIKTHKCCELTFFQETPHVSLACVQSALLQIWKFGGGPGGEVPSTLKRPKPLGF